jgi:hypothetical protein
MLTGEQMQKAVSIKSRVAPWTMLGIVCLVSTPAFSAEPEWWTQQKRDCNLPSNLAYSSWDGKCSSSPGNSASPPDNEAARRTQEAAAAAADRQRQQAIERQAEIKRRNDAEFIRNRDAAASSLKGSSGAAMNELKGLSGSDHSDLKGSGFDSDNGGLIELRGSDRVEQTGRAQPHIDTSVVDARQVPSGLPKGLGKAIAAAYSASPPGVGDRVRKGFQAAMVRDWMAAQAWFQDALRLDPGNAGLRRLVALTDTPQQPQKQPVEVDPRNEPAGLGGKANLKGANVPPRKTKPAAKSGRQLPLPDPDDIYISFPGLKAIEDKEALDYLFGLDPYPLAPKTRNRK